MGADLVFAMGHEGMHGPRASGDVCRDPQGCGGCRACGAGAPDVPYSGRAVVWGALGLFVLPVLLAAGGALLARGSATWQLAGGVGGLALGMGLAWFGHRALNRRNEEGGA